MNYIEQGSQSFIEVFPYSANQYFQTNHYRLYQLYNRVKNVVYRLQPPKHLIDFSKVEKKDIPVILINFNRYQSLKELINWLLQLNQSVSIIIIDNASSYPPLLDYYKKIYDYSKIQILRFHQNNGLRKIIPICQCFKNFEYYVLSDTDLIPYPSTPNDMLEKMQSMLEKYPKINHVGTSLEINDIPSYFPLKEDVINWEKRFWKKELAPNVYDAPIDTTFAMYRNSALPTRIYSAIRLGRPYTLKHIDWYLDPYQIDEEMQFLLQKISPVSTWLTKLKSEISLTNKENQLIS